MGSQPGRIFICSWQNSGIPRDRRQSRWGGKTSTQCESNAVIECFPKSCKKDKGRLSSVCGISGGILSTGPLALRPSPPLRIWFRERRLPFFSFAFGGVFCYYYRMSGSTLPRAVTRQLQDLVGDYGHHATQCVLRIARHSRFI